MNAALAGRGRLAAGWLLALLLLAGAWLAGKGALREALQGYLVGWLFCLMLPLGSLGLLCIHRLTGGRWGRALQGAWLASVGLLPWVALLALPLVVGAARLFPWVGAGPASASTPHWYLNLPFLYLRLGGCFALWLVLAWPLRRWRTPVPSLAEQGRAGVSLLLLLLTISVTGVDWIMSLVPEWHSTALGLLLMTCCITVALSWSLLVAGVRVTADLQLRRDFGNLLLACVLGWAYLAFMDYLTAWIADQPAETVWYLPRLQWPWAILPVMLLLLQLGVPLALLLPRRGKQSTRVLAATAALVFAMQFANMVWLVLPGLRDRRLPLSWSDPLAWLGLGVAMTLAWRHALRRQSDIRTEEGVP